MHKYKGVLRHIMTLWEVFETAECILGCYYTSMLFSISAR